MENTITMFGVPIVSYRQHGLIAQIIHMARQGYQKTMSYVNVHCFNVAHEHVEYRSALEGMDVVYADGVGVVLASRWLGTPLPERVNIMDFFEPLVHELVRHNATCYFLGGQSDETKRIVDFTQRHYGLTVLGSHHGFFSEKSSADVIQEINRVRPDILFVGMGVPKQELWIVQNRHLLDVRLIWGVGNFQGILTRTPRWIARCGCEWLFRFLREPKRLWRRYLVGLPLFFIRVFLAASRRQRHTSTT